MKADLLPVELLATDWQRRPIGKARAEFEAERRVSVDQHAAFIESIQPQPGDEIDGFISELREAESNREGEP